MTSRGLGLLVAVIVAGFAGPARAETLVHADQCGRANAGALIGRPIGDAAAALAGRPYGVVTVRHKSSGGLVVTGDFRPERLSLVVDRGGRVSQVLCG
ncbi:MAG: hypothetical protein HY060_26660 [Proteobacteria bacterium]|nr:hypothetical protein [Pseudomonadota bacterium]